MSIFYCFFCIYLIFQNQLKVPQGWKLRNLQPMGATSCANHYLYYLHLPYRSKYIFPSIIIWMTILKCWKCRWIDLLPKRGEQTRVPENSEKPPDNQSENWHHILAVKIHRPNCESNPHPLTLVIHLLGQNMPHLTHSTTGRLPLHISKAGTGVMGWLSG